MIEYAVEFLQWSRFSMYLIPNKEKKAKKFDRGLNSRIRIMMSCFNIHDFPQLVDQASIYKESLNENVAKYADQNLRLKDLVLRREELA